MHYTNDMSTLQILERLRPSKKEEIKEIEKEICIAESVLARLTESKKIDVVENVVHETIVNSEENLDVETSAQEDRAIKHLEMEVEELRKQMKLLLQSHNKMLIHESGFDE